MWNIVFSLVVLILLVDMFILSSEGYIGNKLSQLRRRTKMLANIPLYNSGAAIINVPMYLINLEKRTDRLKITMRLLKEKGFADIQRFRAIDSTNNWDHLKQFVAPEALQSIYAGFRTEHNQMSKGAIGCYLSHVELWKKSAEMDTDIIIFEDDVLPTLTYTTLESRLQNVPNGFDIVLFGGFYDRQFNIINRYVCKVDRFYGMQAYLISAHAARFLISKALPITQQVDSFLSDLSEQGYLKIYGLRSNDFQQNPSVNSTDIQTPLVNENVEPDINKVVQRVAN